MYFRHYLLIEKGVILHFSLYPWIIYAKFGWNWPCGSGEEDKDMKSLQKKQTKGQQAIAIWKANVISQLMWAQKKENKKEWLLKHILVTPYVWISIATR